MRSSPKRAVSSSRAIVARIPSRYSRLVPSGTLSIAVGVKPNGRPRRYVIDIGTMRCEEVVLTEADAHTLALDRKRNKIYSFLPQSHRAAVFVDTT